MTGGEGFDDIVILAPSIQAIDRPRRCWRRAGWSTSSPAMCGTEALLDLNPVIDGRQHPLHRQQRLQHRRHAPMLVPAEQGALDTNRTVAAIAGLDGVDDGIYVVSQGTFPGKVVVYPHVIGLGLTPLAQPARAGCQGVDAKLGPGEVDGGGGGGVAAFVVMT